MAIHKPFIVESLLAVQSGDMIKCEAGCDYARVIEAGNPDKHNGWAPKLDMLEGNQSPLDMLMPIRCKCGAIAIK